jgi:hypothetical protein
MSRPRRTHADTLLRLSETQLHAKSKVYGYLHLALTDVSDELGRYPSFTEQFAFRRDAGPVFKER